MIKKLKQLFSKKPIIQVAPHLLRQTEECLEPLVKGNYNRRIIESEFDTMACSMLVATKYHRYLGKDEKADIEIAMSRKYYEAIAGEYSLTCAVMTIRVEANCGLETPDDVLEVTFKSKRGPALRLVWENV